MSPQFWKFHAWNFISPVHIETILSSFWYFVLEIVIVCIILDSTESRILRSSERRPTLGQLCHCRAGSDPGLNQNQLLLRQSTVTIREAGECGETYDGHLHYSQYNNVKMRTNIYNILRTPPAVQLRYRWWKCWWISRASLRWLTGTTSCLRGETWDLYINNI